MFAAAAADDEDFHGRGHSGLASRASVRHRISSVGNRLRCSVARGWSYADCTVRFAISDSLFRDLNAGNAARR